MAGVDLLSTLNKSGSGVNLKELASSLVEASVAPQKTAASKSLSQAEVSISAVGKVRAQLSTLGSGLAALASADILSVTASTAAVSTKVTDRSLLSETAHSLSVVQVAKSQVLEFTGFSAPDAPVGAGGLTVDFGVWYPDANNVETFAANPDATPARLTLDAGATLTDLAAALNDLDGVSATVIDKGDGTYSIGVLTEPGAGSAIRLTATEDAAAPGLAQFDTTARNAAVQVQAAQNAVIALDGITLMRGSNVIDDAIPGVELTLTGTASNATLTVSRSEDAAQANMQSLVTQLNTAMAMLNGMTARKTENTAAGELAGDASIAGISRQIQSLLNAPIAGYGASGVTLSELGVETQRDGTLRLNTQVFSDAFARNPAQFDAVFADQVTTDTPAVTVSGLLATGVTPGAHAFRRDPQTGAATFDGARLVGLDLGDGRSAYTGTAGALSGLVLTVDAGVTEATVSLGKSFVSQLNAVLTGVMRTSGLLDTRQTAYADQASTAQGQLDDLTTRAATLQTNYMTRFAAMEQSVTRFNAVSSYLDSLVAQWDNPPD